MARPGFVLDVDDRTPPVLVASGDTFRLERLPAGARVVYPADSLPAVHAADAIAAALDNPVGSDPLSARLRPGMRLTITFDDNTAPVPAMTSPDLRAKIMEAVLTRAAAAGVDDVALIAAIGLNRRQSAAELRHWSASGSSGRSTPTDCWSTTMPRTPTSSSRSAPSGSWPSRSTSGWPAPT